MKFIVLSLLVWVTIGVPLYGDSPSEIYRRRVLPLLQSSKADSCSECHLQGIQLGDFLTADPKASFAALRARGWIDMKHPEQSMLLQFITKSPETPDALLAQVRSAEKEAIGAWIEASTKDPASLETPLPPLTDLELDADLIQHMRKDQVVHRFVDSIWSQLERCANCHSPDRNAKQVEKNGEQMSWIVPKSPDRTLHLLEARGLIDRQEPRKSLLRAKAVGIEKHGGGLKFPSDGQTDREWVQFLEDYASIQKARYASSRELPPKASIRTWRTGLHLRITDIPARWDDSYGVVFLYRIRSDGTSSSQPIAFGESRVVQARSAWGNSLSLIEPIETRSTEQTVPWEQLLEPGAYQLRWVQVQDPALSLQELIALPASASVDLKSLWEAGHGNAQSIPFASFTLTETPR